MVRIIVGIILDVGVGKLKLMDILFVIESKDRIKVGKILLFWGFYFVDVVY